MSSTVNNHPNYGNIRDALNGSDSKGIDYGCLPAPVVTIRVPRPSSTTDQSETLPSSLRGRVSVRIIKPAHTTRHSQSEAEYVEVPADLINSTHSEEQKIGSLRAAFKALGFNTSKKNTDLTDGPVAESVGNQKDYNDIKSALKSGNFTMVLPLVKNGMIKITPKISREISLEKNQLHYANNTDYQSLLKLIQGN